MFDCEGLCYMVWLELYVLVMYLVINCEWFVFMQDGGYWQLMLWFFDGWVWVQCEGIDVLFYWYVGMDEVEGWQQMLLYGFQLVDLDVLVMYVSFYEVDVYVCWVGVWLLMEVEWEYVVEGFFV